MISRTEIVPYGVKLTPYQDANVSQLLCVLNKIRAEYGMPMIITSGFRTEEDEKRIDPEHPASMHTLGAAVDIWDPSPDSRFWNWLMDHMELLSHLNVWLEDRASTPNHVHCQILPPASGSRIFKP